MTMRKTVCTLVRGLPCAGKAGDRKTPHPSSARATGPRKVRMHFRGERLISREDISHSSGQPPILIRQMAALSGLVCFVAGTAANAYTGRRMKPKRHVFALYH